MITSKIMADSINPFTGKRLVTFSLRYPRVIHAEVMTHRVFARNAESSRARPIASILSQIEAAPYIPIEWGANQKGMQAGDKLPPDVAAECERVWLDAMEYAMGATRKLLELGLHKQWANRIVEPWTHISVVLSSTEWQNYYDLRCDKAAMPEFRYLARLMRWQMYRSTPQPTHVHLPFVTPEELAEWGDAYACQVAVGRLCRVSYSTHEGVRDPDKDVALHDQLIRDKHMSPFEHVAFPWPCNVEELRGCFDEWVQYRRLVELDRVRELQPTTDN